MLEPEIKGLVSLDLEYGKLPIDPENCAVAIEVGIGVRGQEGADIFSFTAVTPNYLIGDAEGGIRWGRGYLILPYFAWTDVERAISKLLERCKGDTWQEISTQLNKEMHWEFDNYQK